MIYSVYRIDTAGYDYFETPEQPVSINVEKPGHLVSRKLGSTIDQAAWPLPGNARHVGSGPTAIGKVATRKSLAMGADSGSQSNYLNIIILAFALTYLMKKSKKW